MQERTEGFMMLEDRSGLGPDFRGYGRKLGCDSWLYINHRTAMLVRAAGTPHGRRKNNHLRQSAYSLQTRNPTHP